MGTNATSLAVIQISLKVTISILLNTPFRAEELAYPALDTLIEIAGGRFRPPIARFVSPSIPWFDEY